MSLPSGQFTPCSFLSFLVSWNLNYSGAGAARKTCTAVLLLLCILLFCCCRTPYQRLGVEGGYTDLNVESNVYRVNFSGNEFTSPEELSDLALLRCAELTVENGHTYFVLLEEHTDSDRGTAWNPMGPCTPDPVPLYRDVAYGTIFPGAGSDTIYYIGTPRSTYRIKVSDDLPDPCGPVFHAAALFENIKNKYGLDLPGPANKAYKSLSIDQKSLLEKVKRR